MKNVNQIKKGIKANGLTGEAFTDELESQCLTFGRELITNMVVETEIREPNYQDLLLFLAHLTEIYITAEQDNFSSGFAESMQASVFSMTNPYVDSFCAWRRETFNDKDFENGIETGAAYPTDESETEKPKYVQSEYTEQQSQSLDEIGQQFEMALMSDKTSQGVKDCLKTIILEASNEANLPLSDLSLIRTAFPNIIKALPVDYGRGVCHSIHSILRFDTDAFQEFYDKRLDEKPNIEANVSEIETDNTALLISDLLNSPHVPSRIRDGLINALDDTSGVDISEINAFWKSPEYIAMVLRGYEKAEVKNEH